MKSTLFAVAGFATVFGTEPNPPNWPDNVFVFSPDTPDETQHIVDQVYSQNGGHIPPCNGQWSNNRWGLLFEAGYHDVEVPIGYYTSLMGIGHEPTDTNIRSVYSENGDYDYHIGGLNNFWRSAENFYTAPQTTVNDMPNTMMWTVSQSCPLRRVVVDGNMHMFQYNYGSSPGWTSGGYLSNSKISGTVVPGTQQQYFIRNTDVGKWDGGNWNFVFVGVKNAPPSNCGRNNGGNPVTTVWTTPVIAEKPYIHKCHCDNPETRGRWFLMVPPVEYEKAGATANYYNVTKIDFTQVYVATDADSASYINYKLRQGLHLVLSPGNYKLEEAIEVIYDGTVVLGFGLPVLEAVNGNAVITVRDGLDGVRVSHVLMQAGRIASDVLMRVGTIAGAAAIRGSNAKHVFLHDIFARVGGPNDPEEYQTAVDTMVEVNSDNVVVDNTWLWRADHDVSADGLVRNEENPVMHGFVVNGQHVTAYGLKVEHVLKDMTVWNGEYGSTYFYQSELPYDVRPYFGYMAYAGYSVNPAVRHHTGYGVGVYSYFRDFDVTVHSGIKTGTGTGLQFFNSMSVHLNGYGSIDHVINEVGEAVNGTTQVTWACHN